jgi:hypothetical protein
MEDDDWIQLEGREVTITEDAPDHVLEWLQDKGDRAGTLLNFLITLEASEHDSADYTIFDADELSEKCWQSMNEAVEEGDIESAQEYKELAEKFGTYYDDFIGLNNGPLNQHRVCAKAVVEELQDKEEHGAFVDTVLAEIVSRTELDVDAADDLIDDLKQSGEVYEPRTDYLRRT